MAGLPPFLQALFGDGAKVVLVTGGHSCAPICPWHGDPLAVVPRLFRAIRATKGADRVSFMGELEGLAFIRRMNDVDYQQAWDACSDPAELFDAIRATDDEHALSLLGEALGRIGAEMERAYDEADPMDWPDAPERKRHLTYVLTDCMDQGSYLGFLLTALEAHAYVTGDAQATREMGCRIIRYFFPNAPWGFRTRTTWSDEALLGRGLQAETMLTEQERSYVKALATRKLPLRTANRSKLIEILCRRTPWV